MYKTVPPKMYMYRNQTCDEGKNVHIQNKLYIILYTRLPKMYTRLYILIQNMYMILYMELYGKTQKRDPLKSLTGSHWLNTI